jgi:hypothetical protein
MAVRMRIAKRRGAGETRLLSFIAKTPVVTKRALNKKGRNGTQRLRHISGLRSLDSA